MPLKMEKAKPKQGYIKAGNYGESGSGKTLTFLLLAEFLAARDPQKRRVAYVDTELGTDFYAQDIPERAVHPKAFDFDRCVTRSLLDVRDFIKDPETEKKYCVIVLDSMTHLWQSAQEAWTGNKTSIGTYPVQAWGPIKRPYKQMLDAGLNGQFHFLICGRLKIEFEEDAGSGKLMATGTTMKAEGETPYEPNLLVHMYQERVKKDAVGLTPFHIKAYIEKDRTGLLTGRTFTDPKPEDFAPLLKYLIGDQGKIETTDEASEKDATALALEKEEIDRFRAKTFQDIKTGINTSSDMNTLKAAWGMTTGKKKILGDELFEQLELIKEARKNELTKAVGV